MQGEHRVKAKRHLLNEMTLGRKVLNVGAKDQAASTVSTESNTDGKTNDDDEENPAFQRYPSTGANTHHYYTDDKKPSRN